MQNPHLPDMKSEADETLVSLAQRGDPGAFGELIRRHRGACTKLALSILRNPHDAEDEVQNSLCKAFVHIGKFQQDAKFTTWLTRIVVNQCLMRLRAVKRSRVVYIEDANTQTQRPFDPAEAALTPEEQLAKVQISSMLRNEIRRIPPLLRNVVVLRDVQQLPMQTVARTLGISLAAAKSRLLRARLELKQRLERHQGRTGPATLVA